MHISLFLPSLNGGGAERVALLLAKGFAARGHSVDVVVMIASGAFINEVPHGVRLVNLDCPRLWTSTPQLIRYLRRQRPAVLISSMPLANGIAVYARFLARVRCTLFLTEHNAVSLVFGDVALRRYKILTCLIRPVYRWADGIIAVSRGVADRVKMLPRIDPTRVSVVYNPVYTPEIDSKSADPIFDVWMNDPTVPVIIGVGRLVLQKDFATLIRAFDLVRRTKPVRLVILGEDVERASLERLISELGLDDLVRLVGFVGNPWAWMARASLFVLSSQHEGLGNVLIEAMACGTPVVSTDCPSGPAEILCNGKFGRLVKVGDPIGLSEAIIDTLKNPIAAEVLRARAHEFSEAAAVDGYLQTISGAMP
jgi:glycosyltransferase involved in cell wall biosynthesis